MLTILLLLCSWSLGCSISGSFDGEGTGVNDTEWAMTLHLHLDEGGVFTEASGATNCLVEAIGTWSVNDAENQLTFTVGKLADGSLDCATTALNDHECAASECAPSYYWLYDMSGNCAHLTLNDKYELARCPRLGCTTDTPTPPRRAPTGWIVLFVLIVIGVGIGLAFHCHMTRRTRSFYQSSSYTQL